MFAQKVLNNKLVRLYKYYVIESVMILRKSGPRELIRQRGKKLLLVVISYYLIRDTVLYVLIPLFLAQGLL